MNHISDEGCDHITEFFKKNIVIKKIDLRDNRKITLEGVREMVKASTKCRHLQSLDFDQCNFEFKG